MAMEGFTLTFEFPPGQGLPADGLADALQGVQDALRRMVEHLGDRQPRSGRPPGWVTLQSTLNIAGARSGSLIIDLELAPPPTQQPYLGNLGATAVDALLSWDGEENSTLPRPVTDRLYEIAEKIPDEVKLWLGNAQNQRRIEIKAAPSSQNEAWDATDAILYGWLREVNWHRRTAQLHDRHGGHIRLRFDADLNDTMLRLATRYVEIRGQGRINAKDEWTSIQVRELNPTGSWNQPFDLEAFVNNPNPRIFDPEQVVRASEPFDVDEFISYIHATRDESPG